MIDNSANMFSLTALKTRRGGVKTSSISITYKDNPCFSTGGKARISVCVSIDRNS